MVRLNKSYQAVSDVYTEILKERGEPICISKNKIAKKLNLNWRTVNQCYLLLDDLGLLE